MAIFDGFVTDLRLISGRVLGEARDILFENIEAAGNNLRGVFFRTVNNVLSLLNEVMPEDASRPLASGIVSFLQSTYRAGAELQRELFGEGGRETVIPVSSRLGNNEVRISGRVFVDIGDDFSGYLYLSYRGNGIPTRAELESAFAEQLETFMEDYEVQLVQGRNLSPIELLTAEGGG